MVCLGRAPRTELGKKNVMSPIVIGLSGSDRHDIPDRLLQATLNGCGQHGFVKLTSQTQSRNNLFVTCLCHFTVPETQLCKP
jgi:hypothetical protein